MVHGPWTIIEENLLFYCMKKCLLITAILFLATGAMAQTKISLEEVKQHIGDSVAVCGKVFGGRYLESSNGTPTLINIGGAYPNELLTVVIFGTDRARFKDKPEDSWKDKNICVKGKITEYRGKPQIVINDPAQVELP
jgi:DNA/RNA endonuclease YhcR with UshA esterase domain